MSLSAWRPHFALPWLLFLAAPADGGGQEKEPPWRKRVLDPRSTYSAATAFDVDRDGDTDVVCGGFWYASPRWERRFLRDVETIRGRFDDYSNLALDVDQDGFTDLVSANYRSGKLYWIEHPGLAGGAVKGPWAAHLVEAPGPMETALLADVDRDGDLDILPNGVRFAAWWEVVLEESDGARRPRWVRHDLPVEVAGHGVGFGDIDGDGRGDIVGARGWLEAPADPRAGAWTWRPELELHRDASIPILVVDADADGDADIVWGRGHDIGLYWLEQRRGEGGARRWVRHAIDTSVSQLHSLLHADLDGDGSAEVVAGKRYMGHDGEDPGEFDPLVVHSYQFDAAARVWRRRVVSWGGGVGFGLDPEAADLDADGDLDLVCPGRSGLYWLENRRIARDPVPGGPPAAEVPRPEYEDHTRVLEVIDLSGRKRRVVSREGWSLRRSHVLHGLERAMGALPGPERRAPLAVEVLERVEMDDYVRTKLSYSPDALEPGDRVPAYLLVPKGLAGKAPAVLCLHQTTAIGKGEPAGLGGRPTLRYADELARRGYVCLAPDYPSFGEYRYDFSAAAAAGRYVSGSMKAVWNNVRAIDLLESLAEVDADRIGCIGHSLGGHNAVFTAAFDQRLRVVVTSCGFTAFHDYYGGNLCGWTSERYMPRIREVYASDPDRVPFDFHELIAALAPRPVFVNAPLSDDNFPAGGVRKVIAAAASVYELWDAADKLQVEVPDAPHEFPDEVRERAYRFLDAHLER